MIRSPLSRVVRHQVGGRSPTLLVGGRAAAWALIVALCIGAASSCGLGHSPDLPIAGSTTTSFPTDDHEGTTGSGPIGDPTTGLDFDTSTGGTTDCIPLGVGGEGGAQPLDDCEMRP